MVEDQSNGGPQIGVAATDPLPATYRFPRKMSNGLVQVSTTCKCGWAQPANVPTASPSQVIPDTQVRSTEFIPSLAVSVPGSERSQQPFGVVQPVAQQSAQSGYSVVVGIKHSSSASRAAAQSRPGTDDLGRSRETARRRARSGHRRVRRRTTSPPLAERERDGGNRIQTDPVSRSASRIRAAMLRKVRRSAAAGPRKSLSIAGRPL